jgi:hypothetical protein
MQKKFSRRGYKRQSLGRLGLIGTGARVSIKDIGTELLFGSVDIRLVGLVRSGSGARVLCITSVHDLVLKFQEMTHACFSVRLDILATVGGKGGGGGGSGSMVGNVFFLLRDLVSTTDRVF